MLPTAEMLNFFALVRKMCSKLQNVKHVKLLGDFGALKS